MGLVVWLIPSLCKAQETFPQNGPHDIRPTQVAFVHATIQVDPKTRINDGLLLISKGRIVYCGPMKALPPGTRSVDLRGKFIYPSFIDVYSDYGIKIPPVQSRSTNYSSNKGAYVWNEAAKPELHGASYFSYDEKASRQLLQAGFGAVLTGTQDGILRGTTTLVLTGNETEQDLIVNPRVTAGASFKKGSSRQDYPGSAMGSVALIRQSLLDAHWHSNQKEVQNIGLAALQQQLALPWIFEAENKLAVLRAGKIGKEFSLKLWIKSNGDEYQRLQEIKATRYPLIVPLNFPKPYDVEDPFDAMRVNLHDLKHWEMAPSNAARLIQNQVPFVLTQHGCADASTFLKNLRLAVTHGLPKEAALAALTTIPAAWMNADADLGSLKAGAFGNFSIWDQDLFAPKARLETHWVHGKEYKLQDAVPRLVTGIFEFDLEGKKQRLQLALKEDKLEAKWMSTDTQTVTLQESEKVYTLNLNRKGQTNSIRISFWASRLDSLNGTVKEFSGSGQDTFGNRFPFFARLVAPAKSDKKPDSLISPSVGKVVYPFTEYGNEILPVAKSVLFKNATVWTNEAVGIVSETDVAIAGGKIIAIGKGLKLDGAEIIDATGKHLTNGIIDEHSHIAIYRGVNECSQNNTAEVRIGDVVNSEDINIYRQLSGGVVACQQLHGSCNPIGGQSSLIKLRWGRSPEEMKIAGADGFIKFALGENVKQSNWSNQTERYPQTRMGVEQVYYDAFLRAREYDAKRKADPKHTRRDLELETLVEILNGKRFVSCHSYVQSEINMLMHVADSLGFRINTFTHILEGYKVADKMKVHGVAASTFADWWAYKYEVVEAIPQNAAILNRMGVVTAINSDDAEMGRRLNQEAAKIVRYGGISETDAWKMVTLNPARMLHLDKQTGSIKAGKDADLVLWSAHPLSIEAKAEMTFVDGICYFSREQDLAARKAIQAERQRLIQKMMEAKQKGEKTKKQVSETDTDYHCDSID